MCASSRSPSQVGKCVRCVWLGLKRGLLIGAARARARFLPADWRLLLLRTLPSTRSHEISIDPRVSAGCISRLLFGFYLILHRPPPLLLLSPRSALRACTWGKPIGFLPKAHHAVFSFNSRLLFVHVGNLTSLWRVLINTLTNLMINFSTGIILKE